MRMRTINEASEHMKAIDPGTALTKTAIRRLVVTGELPSVRVGQKYLLALENLDSYLLGQVETMDKSAAGGIRRVSP